MTWPTDIIMADKINQSCLSRVVQANYLEPDIYLGIFTNWVNIYSILALFRACLRTPKNQKLYKIFRHIESYGTCMKY